MKRIPIKVLSCTLIAAMVLPMAACNKSNSKKREKSRRKNRSKKPFSAAAKVENSQ